MAGTRSGTLRAGHVSGRASLARQLVIDVVDLTQHYGVRPMLKSLNLQIAPGELVAVIGPNGMGKSTLLATMAGVHSPRKRSVSIDGLQRRSSPEAELKIRAKTA